MSIIKSRLKLTMILLLFVVALFGGVYVVSLELDRIHLTVTVLKDGNTIPGANVYVYAVFPNGTKLVATTCTNVYGIAVFHLSVKDVIKPIINWNQAEKRSFTINPGLYITSMGVYNNTVYFGSASTKLPLTTSGPIITSVNLELRHPIKKVEGYAKMASTNIQQVSPWAKSIYSAQKTMRETFFKVSTDQNTKASCGYLVEQYREVAFKCTYSVTKVIDNSITVTWTIGAEISWVTSQIKKALGLDVSQNSVGYISCLAAINYECWEYEMPADGEVYREHRVYIAYYWPDTLDKVIGEDDIEGNQVLLDTATGKGLNSIATILYLDWQELAIPISKFIKYISIKYLDFPQVLNVPLDVNLVFKSAHAICAHVEVYGVEGCTINIYKVEVSRTLNACYQIPAWAIILRT
ncbi:MAG: hypothetical protein NDF58_04890 [archaeon YNP-LCB-024-027]|nr:hypothetical protein [Candidatus Culexarchaeum yellowstonense]